MSLEAERVRGRDDNEGPSGLISFMGEFMAQTDGSTTEFDPRLSSRTTLMTVSFAVLQTVKHSYFG